MAKVQTPKRQKKVNGYKFPENLPKGEVMRDSSKKEWVLGTSIGKGGFGAIYSGAESGSKSSTFSYAIKIEPYENGPLFVEKNVYMKIAKAENVKTWQESKNIKILGMPIYYGSGIHTYNDTKYRFMVMEKYGMDLWSLFQNNQKKFPPATVYRCALQIIDVLHYIHDNEYVHGDIKGANLLCGVKKGTENNIFLVDFGLACKYTTKEFKRDPKQAHNGTIEYTSCDWHQGVGTRRGDLEILGYNLLHWLNSSLPWENDIKSYEKVYEKKKKLMTNVSNYITEHFPEVSKVMHVYFEYVSKLKYDECPNYKYCKDLFTKELKKLNESITGKLEIKISKKHDLTKDLLEESDNEISTPKKRRVLVRDKQVKTSGKKKTNRNATSNDIAVSQTLLNTPRNVTVDSDGDMFYTPDPVKDEDHENSPPVTTNQTPGPKKRQLKKPPIRNKISWRDAPTIKAGNSQNKAGEYTKKKKR